MLMLTRNKGESIDIIDSNTQAVLCTITLLQIITRDRVRLGFNAPAHISIVRDNAVRVLKRGESPRDRPVARNTEPRLGEKLGGGDVGCETHNVQNCQWCKGEG